MNTLRYIDEPLIIGNGDIISKRYAIPVQICEDKHCLECDDKDCTVYPKNRDFALKMINLGADALKGE